MQPWVIDEFFMATAAKNNIGTSLLHKVYGMTFAKASLLRPLIQNVDEGPTKYPIHYCPTKCNTSCDF